MAHVFVVGAGFSKAISETMPALIQLGARIAADVKARPSFRLLPKAAQTSLEQGSIPGGDLEAWLSNLASPAPFLSEAEAYFNAGIFSEIARVIGREIDASERETLETAAPPPWLHKLVHLWNAVGATVVTFNYDTLIEHAAFYIEPLGNQWPNVAFKLLKVHGSTNWWRSRGDGASVVERQPLLPGWGFGNVDREPIGDERVLVPPLAVKSSYYDPSFMRSQWQQARLAMERATKLFIAGYRLPANDLATTTLISQHLASEAEIALINLNPLEPTGVLRQIGRPAHHQIPGPDCISTLVDSYEDEIGAELVPTFVGMLEAVNENIPVMGRIVDADPPEHVGVGKGLHAIVDIESENDRLVLRANEAPIRWEDGPTAITTSRLRRALTERPRRVVIRCGGSDHPALALSLMDAWPHGDQLVRWVFVEA